MTEPSVTQAVPFFAVRSMDVSLAFHVDGLGVTMTEKWIEDDVLRWCNLDREGVSIMLQEDRPGSGESGLRGTGMTICFYCRDALAIYDQAKAAGLDPKEPFVGNAMCVTSFADPDGYRLDFESLTDVPEGTRLSEVHS